MMDPSYCRGELDEDEAVKLAIEASLRSFEERESE